MNSISLQFVEYRNDPAELAKRVDGLIAAAAPPPRPDAPAALVVPHAGYVYSGPIAGHAYRTLQGHAYDTVVVLGPSHREPFTGLSVYDTSHFDTPLGQIPCDRELIGGLLGSHPNIRHVAGAHRNEHSLEVQVPFLQRALAGFNLVMVVIGGRDPEAEITFVNTLAAYAKKKRVLVVASSDLSHYHPYAEANRLDTVALKSIVALDAAALEKDIRAERCEACGILPVLTALSYVKTQGVTKGVLLKQANSGDTAGPKDQVVGYAAVAFYRDSGAPPAKPAAGEQGKAKTGGRLDTKTRRELLGIARRAIEETVRTGKTPDPATSNPALLTPQGAFVTLTIDGRLRGCIGTFQERDPLHRTVSNMAVAAARQDPRFPPLTKEELSRIRVEISALTPMQPVADVQSIEVGRHGLSITKGYHAGVLLPQVATEYGWDRRTFLEQTCRKAGLGKDDWKSGATIHTFEAEVFGEE